MYWNNPLIDVTWPSSRDPIVESCHDGTHCLFYNPTMAFDCVHTYQTLQDVCDNAMAGLKRGLQRYINDSNNHYDIANLVKFNMWVSDIRRQGIVKPWMMLDQGDGTYLAGTGDSRLKCLEVIPEILSVPAFVSTTSKRAHLYQDLEPVTSFDQFARLCHAQAQQQFLFRLTDDSAPYGIYWYEYNTERTRSVTPSESWCVTAFANYAKQCENLSITKSWFGQLQDWQTFAD